MEYIAFEIVAVLTPVVIGLVQGVKKLGLPEKWAPIASLIFGVVLCFLLAPAVPQAILTGIVAGLTASGLYSGTRAVIEK